MIRKKVHIKINDIIGSSDEEFLDLLEVLLLKDTDPNTCYIVSDISYRLSGCDILKQTVHFEVRAHMEEYNY